MKSPILRAAFAASIVLGMTGSANAQVSSNRVAAETDWSVFVEDSPKECWGVSAPKETVNTKDGQPVAVRRGDILLFVTYRGGASTGEVSFTGGYPFAGGSTVELDIGGTKFELFSEGEWAWSAADDDSKIVAALKAGTTAVVSGRSGRGTKTQDTFSLLGVSAALDEAAKRCAG
ncbi:MAG: invasion associated locus B family protein [Paracoccaceae bacterium]|nr:invasion associated locus B family protein [Paracoccaceae bacterium]